MSDEKVMIPYIVYEGEQARHERTTKRLILVLVLTIILFFLSNYLWLRAWMSYDYATEDSSELISVDGGTRGTANYIGEDGSIVNGENNRYQEDSESDAYTEWIVE